MAIVKKTPVTEAQVLKVMDKNAAAVRKLAPTPPVKVAANYVVKITGQPEKAYRANCMRAKWWTRFNSFNGKPLSDLEASCMKDPPSLPKKAEGDAAKMEKFSGWLAFFKDDRGHVALETRKAK